MSTTDLKKTKRRKNKSRSDNCSSKLQSAIASSLSISKIEQIMDAERDSPPALNIAQGSNPFFVDKCLICQKEKKECVTSQPAEVNWGEFEKLPCDISNYTQLPLWICNECLENGEHKDVKEQETHFSSINVDNKFEDLTLTGAMCNCQACFDKRNPKRELHPLQLDESFTELSGFIKQVYKDGGIDWTEEKNSRELMLLERLKDMINRWCESSSQELFSWLEFQVRNHIMELKMNLLTNIRENGMSPVQAKLFMIELLEGYARLCCASKRLRSVVVELEKDYLKALNLNWELVNRRLFQTIIYADERIETVLPVLIHQLETLEKDEKEQKNVTSMLQKYRKLDEQMRIVAVMWTEAEPVIKGFNNAQIPIKERLKLHQDDDDELLERKLEQQMLKICESGIHKSPCEECTLKYLLTCKLLPKAETNVDLSSSTLNPPLSSSIMSSVINSMDANTTEKSDIGFLSKEHNHCFGNSLELPNGIKKVLGEDNVKRLAEIMGRAVGCTTSGLNSLLCKNSNNPSGEREPGDGAPENSIVHHALKKSCFEESVRGQCHACSVNSNANQDHLTTDTASNSVERVGYETPCECHVCVQHADRATIPSVISNPLPATLHLYPHIHGTNSDHSINSHLFKPVLHSHVHEIYSSVSSTKCLPKDSEKSAAKLSLNDYIPDSTKFDCCQSKLVQTAKSCAQSKLYSPSATADAIKTSKSAVHTTTSNVSVTQTIDINKINEASSSKCVTHNKAVQATSSMLGWSGVSQHIMDHRVKHAAHNHTSSALLNGNPGVQKSVDVSCCVNECFHGSSKSKIRPHITEDVNGATIIHSCGHHNGHTHSSTTIKHICRESRCNFRESQSLSPSRSCTDGEYIRGGDGEDCLDDSCSEKSSSTSTSNTKDAKQCDCCYCEVFGHDVATIPSTSRNYTEIRDKLRQRLSRKKMEQTETDTGISKKQPQEDCRDLDSLINFINGSQVVHNSIEILDNSPKKVPKVVKKLNKKLKKTDGKIDLKLGEGKEVSSCDLNEVDGTDESGSSGEKSLSSNDYNSTEDFKSNVKLKLPINGRCQYEKANCDISNDYKDNEVLRKNDCSISNLKETSILSCIDDESSNNSTISERNDKKKKFIKNSNASAKPWTAEDKATLEKQTIVANFKLKKQLPYQNKNDLSVAANEHNYEIIPATKFEWNDNRSPSPTVCEISLCTNSSEKANKHNSGPSERANSEPSPRKYRNLKDNKIKNGSISAEKPQSQSPPSVPFSHIVSRSLNGIETEKSSSHTSPLAVNQLACKGKKIKKKQTISSVPSSIDEVFLPRDIDLDNGELDEMERELEAFKRFCWNSVPVPNKEKIRVNLKDLNFRKKAIVECN